jgi:anti-sigma factor RsiW
MSTALNNRDISAYFDGELSGVRNLEVERALDSSAQAQLARYRNLGELLHGFAELEPPDSASAEIRVWQKLQRSITGIEPGVRWWKRSVVLPVPLVVAASLFVGLLVGVVGGGVISSPSVPALAQASGVDLHIQVEAQHTAELLAWLDSQQEVQQVSIQLPDSAQFQFRGEPVLARAADLRRGSSDDSVSGELQIVPLISPEESKEE